MAAGSKKRSSGKKRSQTSRKTNGGIKKAAEKKQEDMMFTQEVLLWVVVAVSLLLFISNLGFGGTIGNAVSRFFFGVFGLIAYIFPVILLLGTFFAISNRGNRIAVVKCMAAALFVLFLCMFFELSMNGADLESPFDAYHDGFEKKLGGGYVGGLLTWLIAPNFGIIGSYVIDIIVLIISLVLITERSALRGMQRGGKRVYESAKVSNERYRERAEIRKEERNRRRMDKKAQGVALDTRVVSGRSAAESDEVSEIYADAPFDLPEVKEEKYVSLTAGDDSFEATVSGGIYSLSADEEQALEGRLTGRPVPANASSLIEEFEIGADTVIPSSFSDEAMPFTEDMSAPDTDADLKDLSCENGNTYYEAAEKESEITAKQKSKKQPETGSFLAGEIKRTDETVTVHSAPEKAYVFPPLSLLTQSEKKSGDSKKHLQETALKLQQTLKNFGVNVTITNISCGPSVTRYELQPEMGVKVSKIVNLSDDIKLNLAAEDIRIEAPIPGKAAIGIEVPNKENVMVSFRELAESEDFLANPSKISVCVGKDIGGKVMVTDIAKMPHLLIAGSTGSGKSVCINTIIMSILYKADPRDVKLIMVDPKVVELSVYNGIPHLMIPVVTDPKKAAGALHWAVAEMTDRYQKFAESNVRDLKGYNSKIESLPTIDGEPKPEKLPQIVIIVDELADLMMVAAGDVEEAICRLAQLARAAGIHLIIATQRPSVNVITGLIKANMPSRIAFAVTSGIDSRTILDMNGAEKLLGKGDMLFNPQGVPKPIRVQGAFVSDKEVSDVVHFIKEQNGQNSYSPEIVEKLNSIDSGNTTVSMDSASGAEDGKDPHFTAAARLLIDKEKGSIGMLQRYFKVGFNRAARIMDQLEEAGIVGPEEGTKPRRVLMSEEEFEQYTEECL